MSLYLRNKIWWIYLVNEQGKAIRKTTRTGDKKQAQQVHDLLRAKLKLYPKSVTVRQATLQEAIEMWLAHATYKATFARDKRVLKVFGERLGRAKLADLKSIHIHEVLKEWPYPLKRASVNCYLSIIKAVLRRSERVWELVDRIPNITLLPNTERRIRYITQQEAKRLLEELPEHQKDIVKFSLLTGLRKSNVLNLCWEQVDLARGTAWIHADQSKSRRPIAVPLNTGAIELLTDRARRAGWGFGPVFTYKSKPITQINTKAFRKGLAKAGIKDFRWHDLRHTWATWHIQAGTPLHVLQELGGWHSYAMVQRYAHLSSEHLKNYTGNASL